MHQWKRTHHGKYLSCYLVNLRNIICWFYQFCPEYDQVIVRLFGDYVLGICVMQRTVRSEYCIERRDGAGVEGCLASEVGRSLETPWLTYLVPQCTLELLPITGLDVWRNPSYSLYAKDSKFLTSLNLYIPAMAKAEARRKISLEIIFVCLGNKGIYRIFKAYCKSMFYIPQNNVNFVILSFSFLIKLSFFINHELKFK
jgi:hypothetical protein